MEGLFDIHTHIIPDYDDGSGSLEETEAMLKKEYEDGVRTVFATSHYRQNMFENTLEAYDKGFETVRKLGETIGIRILKGCEFHASMDMIEILNSHGRYPYEGSRCVLTEFRTVSPKQFMKERCYSLLSSGYIPVIAHFERYDVCQDLDFVAELINMGAYMQMNSQSMLGDDGLGLKHYCRKALKNGLVHFIASDCHNNRDRQPTIGRAVRYLNRLVGEKQTEKLLIGNPQELIIGNGIDK